MPKHESEHENDLSAPEMKLRENLCNIWSRSSSVEMSVLAMKQAKLGMSFETSCYHSADKTKAINCDNNGYGFDSKLYHLVQFEL